MSQPGSFHQGQVSDQLQFALRSFTCSCKYWQHLGGGLQTLRAATLISAPFHLKASVQQAQKTGAG